MGSLEEHGNVVGIVRACYACHVCGDCEQQFEVEKLGSGWIMNLEVIGALGLDEIPKRWVERENR